MGNALQTDGQAIYGARDAALKAGIPVEVPALTVNRICGSGLQSIVSGLHELALEGARVAVTGRHGEHEPGTARPARRTQGVPARACRPSSRISSWRR